MRKSIINQDSSADITPFTPATCLDLAQLAQVSLTSEATGYPIESALLPGSDVGWRAAFAGEQTIRVIFDQPLTIKHIRLSFNEQDSPRTQEFVLRWSTDKGAMQEIIRQQYHFSPPGTTSEIEAYAVDLPQLKLFELIINPDISNDLAFASLKSLRLWQNNDD